MMYLGWTRGDRGLWSVGELIPCTNPRAYPYPNFQTMFLKVCFLSTDQNCSNKKGPIIYNFSKQDPDEIILKYHANEHSAKLLLCCTSNIIVTEMCRVEGGGVSLLTFWLEGELQPLHAPLPDLWLILTHHSLLVSYNEKQCIGI